MGNPQKKLKEKTIKAKLLALRQSKCIPGQIKKDTTNSEVYAAKQVTVKHLREYMNCQNSTNLLDILVLIDTDQ